MQVLGSASFLVTPDVNGDLVLTATDPIMGGTGALTLPSGTTAERPVGVSGMVRWNSTLGYQELYNGAEWQPFGRVLQVVSGNIPAITGSTTIATALTAAPTTAGGILIWTQSFTPISAASRLIISFGLNVSHGNAARTIIASTFAGSTNIGSAATYNPTANVPGNISYQTVYSPGSTAAITFTARCGSTGAGTIAVSQVNTTTGTLGGAAATEYTITEIL